MSKPTLILIPGLWEGPTAFSKVLDLLSTQHNYPATVIPLVSTGTESPQAQTFSADVAAIHDSVEKLANDGEEIILTMHSAGAYIGSQSIQGLSLAERKAKGKTGGVRKLVYLAGGLLPEGSDHEPVPFFETVGNRMYPHSPLTTLFHDIAPAEAETYARSLSWQPASYRESIHVTYCAWKEIPSVYLCCTEDRIMPLEFQQKMAGMAGAEVESCDAGHMVVLSQPERVVEVVLRAAGEV